MKISCSFSSTLPFSFFIPFHTYPYIYVSIFFLNSNFLLNFYCLLLWNNSYFEVSFIRKFSVSDSNLQNFAPRAFLKTNFLSKVCPPDNVSIVLLVVA